VKALKNTCAGRHSGAKKKQWNYAVGCAERKMIPGSSAARTDNECHFLQKESELDHELMVKKVAKSKLWKVMELSSKVPSSLLSIEK
jgi:hypothetical protein